ncbi:MAG: UPF0104 family protein [Spirulinaceae cyanobacterium SM2_1_0]|nr:UPF0104 family protein [Spirulinaceae cyanobacterium SM2_1_0]
MNAKRLKLWLRWLVLAAVAFFLVQTLRSHWQAVLALDLRQIRGSWLLLGWTLTLLAHGWTGWVWAWILAALAQPVPGWWSVGVYLRTNVAKYLPGNVWHLYGRVRAAQTQGASLAIASLSVLIEALLLVAAGLIVALITAPQASGWPQWLGLVLVLASLHPLALNPLLGWAGRLKGTLAAASRVSGYPLQPLLGEIGFLLWRSAGFLATVMALTPLAPAQWLPLTGAYSFAWLLGMVIPGAPGGIGVFEVVAIRLLDGSLEIGIVITAIAIYRLSNTLAEVAGAGLAWNVSRWADRRARSR